MGLIIFNRMHGVAERRVKDLVRWRVPLLSVSLGFALLLAFYRDTVQSMVYTWSHSNTFTHGFFIFPIFLYLLFRLRNRLAALEPEPDFRALVAILLVGFAWIVANLAQIQVFQQFFLVFQVITIFWAILGIQVLRVMAFPLAFFFFAVPFGEVFVPGLMQFTADFTVALIRLTGIPVFRDGNTFSLPSGNWSVVEACSGIRYLIASVTLGFLFAYLNYNSLWRRAAFIAISVIVPIVANGLRAFLIVMIGHFSEMKYAVGVDHLIYGWLFFGLIMLCMFWIGSFWSEASIDVADAGFRVEPVTNQAGNHSFILITVIALAAAGIWPLQAARIGLAASVENASPVLELPKSVDGWRLLDTGTGSFEPNYQGATLEIKGRYTKSDSNPVGLFVYYYTNQKQGRELINSTNVVASTQGGTWHLRDMNRIEVNLAGGPFRANQWRLASSRKNRLVWEWYWVGNEFLADDYLAKLFEVKAKLTGENTDSAAIIVSVEYDESLEAAADVLRRFTEEMVPSIRADLERAAGR